VTTTTIISNHRHFAIIPVSCRLTAPTFAAGGSKHTFLGAPGGWLGQSDRSIL